ncbi:hypothetical protein [Streptomyces sp. BH055]|uniref:hypothetical protein n=1 Tax=Streptomyces sp. BH055 TaxID=3401173 RepID=UPI003BB56C62
MAHEVVEEHFRSELHLRWSVFFDHLNIPYSYEPTSFRSADGQACTPAFWLPHQRIWFDAEPDAAPAWWERFALCARGDTQGTNWTGMFEKDWEDRQPPPGVTFVPFDVSERWRGQALLSLGDLPPWATGDWGGPWDHHPEHGMYTADDALYRWTLCPACGMFGAEYGGYAERLSCQCLNPDKVKLDNSGDPRLMKAYLATDGPFASEVRVVTAPARLSGREVIRACIVEQRGEAAARQHCVGTCFSLGEQWRSELPPGAFAENTPDADVLCSQCPGHVCCSCGERPADAGQECSTCDPPIRLNYTRARQLLNEEAANVGAAARRTAREINTLLNRAVGRKCRPEYSLQDLATALTLAQQWREDPDLLPSAPAPAPFLTQQEIETLSREDAAAALNQLVGRLVSVTGFPFRDVQSALTKATGAARRKDADLEMLHDVVALAQRCITDPAAAEALLEPAYRQAQRALPLPPLRTRPTPCAGVCPLCRTPFLEGETLGRLPHRGGDRYAAMGWVCAHCLLERRTKPRRRDLALRIFHHLIPGAPVRLNHWEARTLGAWLAEAAAPPVRRDPAALCEARQLLQGMEATDDDNAAVELRFEHAEAVITALCPAPRPDEVSSDDGDLDLVVLHAVAHYLALWRANPHDLDRASYERRALWRLDMMAHDEAAPAVLATVPGPFAL